MGKGSSRRITPTGRHTSPCVMRERYSGAAVCKVVWNSAVGNDLTHRMNNGQLKERDGRRHTTENPPGRKRYIRSEIRRIGGVFDRYWGSEGNHTVAQSHRSSPTTPIDRRFRSVSPPCLSPLAHTDDSSGEERLRAQIFGKAADHSAYRRPCGPIQVQSCLRDGNPPSPIRHGE